MSVTDSSRKEARQGVRARLGEILVREGRLSQEALEEAVLEARANGDRLGAHLLRAQAVAEEDISIALAEQFGLRYVQIDASDLDPRLAALLPERTARRLGALPLGRTNDRTRLAIADPADVVLVDEIRIAMDGEFELVVADPSTIRTGLAKLYSPNAFAVPFALDEEHDESEAQLGNIAVDEVENSPAVDLVNRILKHAIELGASDLHFVPRKNDLHVRARVDGVMRDLSIVPRSERSAVITRLKVMGQLDIAERRLPQDGRVSISVAGTDMDLRVAVLPAVNGEEAVLRISYIGKQGFHSLPDLSFDERTLSVLRHALRNPAGAIVIAGPTGSGKTTTLYAAIEELNNGSRTIVSIEDPVESMVEGVVQVEVNARAGLTFARGLRTILRADPDVIMIGEIRDLETAEIALHAAMTGHVVLTTVHAQSAAAGIVRLRELGLSEASIGSSVRTVLSQRLLRRPCPVCYRGERHSGEELARIGIDSRAELFRPAGCDECDFTGYAGRIGIYEALTVDDDLRAAMGGTASTIAGAAAGNGTTFLYEQGRRLCEAGATTVDEVVRVLGESEAL